MSDAAIICVGDELVSGDISDRNGSIVASFLTSAGLVVKRITLIGDSVQAIAAELASSSAKCDLLVVTGGLGPTQDDRTREALGLFVGQGLEFDAKLWNDIQSTLGRTLSGSNRSQAFRPALFTPLLNGGGTAPGLIADVGGCRVVALPGPPVELTSMLHDHAEQILEGFSRAEPEELVFTAFAVPESVLEDALQAGDGDPDLEWHTRAEPFRIVTRICGGNPEVRESFYDHLVQELGADRLARGEEVLASVVLGECRTRDLKLAAAESCTGGMIGTLLTDVAGSSDVFWGSWVTYANDAKERLLGVTGLAEHGAVSEATVVQMAERLLEIAGVSATVAVSGIAGPGGGSEEKPVGTVWIGVCLRGRTTTRSFHFSGNRDRVRRAAATHALVMLRSALGNLDRG